MSWCSPKIEDLSEDDFIDKNAVQIARQLQRLRGIDEDDKSSEESPYGNRVEKRKTIYNLEKRLQKQRTIGTLDVAFRKRFLNISNNLNEGKLFFFKEKFLDRHSFQRCFDCVNATPL